jgi:bla regulator protein blaR1
LKVAIPAGAVEMPGFKGGTIMPRSKCLLWITIAIVGVVGPYRVALCQEPDLPAWETAAGGKMAFEVASVRLNPGAPEPSNFRLSPDDAYAITGGLLNADVPLATYIEFAYKMQPTREQFEALYAHVPKWVQTDRYEIHARAGEQNPTKDQMRLMMQALLKERFGLVVHYETADTSVFEMSLAKPGKLGPKLLRHEDAPSCSVTAPPSAGALGAAPGGVDLKGTEVFPATCGGIEAVFKPNQTMLLGGRDTTMESIAGYLSVGRLGRPIVNETGLKGRYDFTLNWSPEPGTFRTGAGAASQDPPATDPQGSTFVEALREQLGLKLKAAKTPLKVLMIDRVSRPTEN